MNGEGGIGKTTLAVKYFHDYGNQYKNIAWVSAENGILEGVLNLASSIECTFTDQMTNEERLDVLLKDMAALDGPNLLIIDNANEIKDLESNYSKLRTCNNFHLLLTSRINEYRKASFYKIQPLPIEEARDLFIKYYPKHESSENDLLDKIFKSSWQKYLSN